MRFPLLVGLDVGTTSCKATVCAADGRELTYGRAVTPWRDTRTGAEADPHDLLRAALDAVGEALEAAPEGDVAALGITSIGESGVLVDAGGEPVAPVIAWHDSRDEREVAELFADIGAEEFAAHAGLPLRGQWSLTKHRWLRAHEPATRRAVRRFNIAEWFVRALGGDEASEQSLASRTGWLDLATRDWWPRSLEWAGMAESLLPDLAVAGDLLGRVSSESAHPRLHGAALTVAGQDHQAACIGAGATASGDVLDSCGSAEALVRTVQCGLPDAAVRQLASAGITVGWGVLPEHWCLLGATQGGIELQRTLRSLELTDVGQADANGSPVWRAAVEAVTREIAGLHETMTRAAGEHRRFVVTGGWARSTTLLAAKRRAFGSLLHPEVTEAGARGAALFGGLAAGVYSTVEEFPAARSAAPGTEVSRV